MVQAINANPADEIVTARRKARRLIIVDGMSSPPGISPGISLCEVTEMGLRHGNNACNLGASWSAA
jgi:hypothetical protein